VAGELYTSTQVHGNLRPLLGRSRLLVAPGVYDGLSARIVEQAGFESVYVSGGAVARSMGTPDFGLLTMTEVLDRLREVVDAVSLPVIADADSGYGNALNVARTVREFERLGVAALHLEDQVTPKRCGHYEGKAVISRGEMVAKLKAALDVRRNPDLVIIARTDAGAVNGLDDALDRAQTYAEAGADMIFVEAPRSYDEIERVARSVAAPLVINMFAGGKTPLVPAHDLERLGYQLMIVPSDLQRAAIWAMREAARRLRTEGSTEAGQEQMVSFRERDELVDLEHYEASDQRYGRIEDEWSDSASARSPRK
jgi:2-methylisocitrate lyase-like PEP mutase family enzyme